MSELTIKETTAMGIWEAVKKAFAQYGTFAGRAHRAEFWWFMLFTALVGLGAQILDAAIFRPMGWDGVYGPLFCLWFLATFLPAISVSVRRLHDLNRSGWWWWLQLIPGIGSIIMLIWFASRGTEGPNHFGADALVAPRI